MNLFLRTREASQQKNYAAKNLSNGQLIYKQVARIICHIRDTIHTQYPQLIMPSRQMIEYLAFNSCDPSKFSENWHQLLVDTLTNLRDLTDVGLEDSCAFTHPDGTTPLFPNFELFDEWDAHRFSQAMLLHIDTELN